MSEIVTTKPWVVYGLTLRGMKKVYFGCCKDANKRFLTLCKELLHNRGNAPKAVQKDFNDFKMTSRDVEFWVIYENLSESDAYRIVGELINKYNTDRPEIGWNTNNGRAAKRMARIHSGLPTWLKEG